MLLSALDLEQAGLALVLEGPSEAFPEHSLGYTAIDECRRYLQTEASQKRIKCLGSHEISTPSFLYNFQFYW